MAHRRLALALALAASIGLGGAALAEAHDDRARGHGGHDWHDGHHGHDDHRGHPGRRHHGHGHGHGEFPELVFGPKVYTRSARPPHTVTDRFTACRPDRRFQLRVENGPGRTKPLTSASVVLNGVEVLKPSDFKRKTEWLERPVHLAAQNTLVLRLGGDPGAALELAVVSDVPCVDVKVAFTSPAPGGTVPVGLLSVTGTLAGLPDAGVTVNGQPAFVEGTVFTAIVPVTPEVTELVAVATRPDGTMVEARQPIQVPSPAETVVYLHAGRAGGLPPVATGFFLSTLVGVEQLTFDPGDGSPPFEAASREALEAQTFSYTQPGVYTATVRVTAPGGAVHTATAEITVYEAAALDMQLQAVWQSFKDALRAGEVARGVAFIHSETRTAYEQLFTQLGPAVLADVDQHLTAIDLVDAGLGGAEAEMLRQEDGQTYSYAIWFLVDLDGAWRLSRF
jgi:hypothetical protein